MLAPLPVCRSHSAALHARYRKLTSVILLRRLTRHIAFGQIARKRSGIAAARIAVTAAAGALQQEAVAGRHLDAGRGLGLELLLGAEQHHEAGAAARLAPRQARRRKGG